MEKRFLTRLVHERVVMSVITANTIVLILRGFREVCATCEPLLFWLDYAFAVYFLGEMVVKLGTLGWREFWRVGWNRFDIVIVALSTPVLLAPWIESSDAGFFLILRCVRLLRLVRGFRFIPDRDKLWTGIKRALRASVGVFVWLVVYNLILGLGAHVLFGEVAPKHFDNPLLAMYSLIKVFTVEGWFDIPDHIAAVAGSNMALLARAYFVFAVTTGGILGLSLANAVFVDEMTMDNTDALDAKIDRLHERVLGADRDRQRELHELRERLDTILARLPQA